MPFGRTLFCAGLLAAGLVPGAAQSDPGAAIGPCSPYAAEGGDIPSELPGCRRRARPTQGSLADELDFRRARRPGEADPAPGTEGEDQEAARPPRPRRRPTR